jgi:non-ribosomal peptide synthase protein (TIGR01720 family)
VSFNYLGQFDQVVDAESIFQGADPLDKSEDDIAARHHLQATQPQIRLSLDAMVTGKKLKIVCTYDAARHRQSTMERLVEWLVADLRDLITSSRSTGPQMLLASDFPQANLTQAELETFLSNLGKGVAEEAE